MHATSAPLIILTVLAGNDAIVPGFLERLLQPHTYFLIHAWSFVWVCTLLAALVKLAYEWHSRDT